MRYLYLFLVVAIAVAMGANIGHALVLCLWLGGLPRQLIAQRYPRQAARIWTWPSTL
jgi:hypothetical protein